MYRILNTCTTRLRNNKKSKCSVDLHSELGNYVCFPNSHDCDLEHWSRSSKLI